MDYLFLERIRSDSIVKRLIITACEIFAWIIAKTNPHQTPWPRRKVVCQRWQNDFQFLTWNFRFICQRTAQPNRLAIQMLFDHAELIVGDEFVF